MTDEGASTSSGAGEQPATPVAVPASSPTEAIYFDGRSSRKHAVTLCLGDKLDIIETGALLETWVYDDIRRADGPRDRLRLRNVKALPLARLEVTRPDVQQQLLSRCGQLDAGHQRHVGRIIGLSLLAAASIVFLVLYGIPYAAARLAMLIPIEAETRIGQAVERQLGSMFGDRFCDKPDGKVVLETLVAKLAKAGGLERPLTVQVVDSAVPNAFALPGGKVYVLRGLLDKAENADELGAVLAHELGHVSHRDALRTVIQNGGSSYLIGLLFGDVLGGGAAIFATRSLFDAAYSRDVERDADAFAIVTMQALGRSPKALTDLLFRITGAKGDHGLGLVSTHPLTEERRETMSRADQPATGAPLLSEADWQSLKTICGPARSDRRPAAAGRRS